MNDTIDRATVQRVLVMNWGDSHITRMRLEIDDKRPAEVTWFLNRESTIKDIAGELGFDIGDLSYLMLREVQGRERGAKPGATYAALLAEREEAP